MSGSRVYKEVPLTDVLVSPFQTRKKFDGKKQDELVESIKAKGQITAAVVRPKGKKFELVFGERRLRALKKIAQGNGGLDKYTLYAEVRDLSDDEAFDIMTIENLQREDLTPLEEAEGFKIYLDKKGPESLKDLAERTGIDARYIRRHVGVLSLPKKILKAWQKDELKFGHLEQLLRLPDNKIVLQVVDAFEDEWNVTTVKEFKQYIDRAAVELKTAMFDLAEEGCTACGKNSDVQKSLFDLGADKKTVCLNPECFKKKQTSWMAENWSIVKIKLGVKTNGFLIVGSKEYHTSCEYFPSDSALAGCKACDDYKTLLKENLQVSCKTVCNGGPNCMKQKLKKKYEIKKEKASTAAGDALGTDEDIKDEATSGPEPRVEWHGRHFREEFYKDAIPPELSKFKELVGGERMLLLSMLMCDCELSLWFQEKNGIEGHYTDEILEAIIKIDPLDIKDVIQEAVKEIIMSDQLTADDRHLVAQFCLIDLKKEWRITEEYLQKKTTKEIHAIAEEFKIFEKEEAKTFLYETLLKKPGRFGVCKKGELVRIFMESGVDLAGVVPKEILSFE